MFGNTIRNLRVSRNYTQGELAEKLNTTQQTVARWESEETFPRKPKLEKLASIFGVSVDTFYDKPKDEQPPEPRALESIINAEPLTYNGVPLTDDDREKVRRALEVAFWNNSQGTKSRALPHSKMTYKELPENAEVLTVAEQSHLHKYRALTNDHRVAVDAVTETYYATDAIDKTTAQQA